MKKLIAMCLLTALVLVLSACADAPNAQNAAEQDNESSSSTILPNEDNISVSVKDLQSNMNQWHHFALEVSHNSNKYLTAEIYGSVVDPDGNILGETTAFIHNLGPSPTDWESIPFLAKGASEYFSDCKIISYSFNDGFEEMPEVTTENIKEYLRITVEDYGDSLNGEKQITVNLHNLTPQYFNGEVLIKIKDSSGNKIKEKIVDCKNLEPYMDDGILIWFPILNDYTVEYLVPSFQFSEDLMP